MERLGYFDYIVPSRLCIVMKQHGVRGGKFFLKSPGNVISETLNFKIFLDASALKSLCLWCEFCLLFIISLPRQLFIAKQAAKPVQREYGF